MIKNLMKSLDFLLTLVGFPPVAILDFIKFKCNFFLSYILFVCFIISLFFILNSRIFSLSYPSSDCSTSPTSSPPSCLQEDFPTSPPPTPQCFKEHISVVPLYFLWAVTMQPFFLVVATVGLAFCYSTDLDNRLPHADTGLRTEHSD